MRISKKIIIAFIAVTFFSACNQEEDVVYSCDKVTNEWTKENLAEIRLMSRADWKKLDEVKKRAAYRAFTPNQKFVFWKEKFSEVKALNWSDAERLHIQRAEDFLNTHASFFNNPSLTEEENDELELFFYKWKEESIQQLGWNENVSLAILVTGNEMEDKSGKITFKLSPNNNYISRPDCDCRVGVLNSCPILNLGDCERVDCDETNYGCGIAWLQPCTGTCK